MLNILLRGMGWFGLVSWTCVYITVLKRRSGEVRDEKRYLTPFRGDGKLQLDVSRTVQSRKKPTREESWWRHGLSGVRCSFDGRYQLIFFSTLILSCSKICLLPHARFYPYAS